MRPRKSLANFDYVLIDDTSRLSRDLGDILTLQRKFNNQGVHLYFVKQQLDSKNPHFRMLLMLYSMVDKQMVNQTRRSRGKA
jgi:DNA invertase Pin-like site-specific DNA recombinase